MSPQLNMPEAALPVQKSPISQAPDVVKKEFQEAPSDTLRVTSPSGCAKRARHSSGAASNRVAKPSHGAKSSCGQHVIRLPADLSSRLSPCSLLGRCPVWQKFAQPTPHAHWQHGDDGLPARVGKTGFFPPGRWHRRRFRLKRGGGLVPGGGDASSLKPKPGGAPERTASAPMFRSPPALLCAPP